MITPEDFALVLHDGACAAENQTLSQVLHVMADSMLDLAAHRQRDDWNYRLDEIREIHQVGSREAGR